MLVSFSLHAAIVGLEAESDRVVNRHCVHLEEEEERDEVAWLAEAEFIKEMGVVHDLGEDPTESSHVDDVKRYLLVKMHVLPVTKLMRNNSQNLIIMVLVMLKQRGTEADACRVDECVAVQVVAC